MYVDIRSLLNSRVPTRRNRADSGGWWRIEMRQKCSNPHPHDQISLYLFAQFSASSRSFKTVSTDGVDSGSPALSCNNINSVFSRCAFTSNQIFKRIVIPRPTVTSITLNLSLISSIYTPPFSTKSIPLIKKIHEPPSIRSVHLPPTPHL